jgi:YD repeat-containing protein
MIQYGYSATQNNGQITQAVDNVSGETIAYQYDALRRLTSAASTPIAGTTPTAWTQTFQYDGFGNLTAKVLNGTTTPIPVNAATNQLSSAYYDANGNMTSGAGATLAYDWRTGFSRQLKFLAARSITTTRRTTSGFTG